MKCQILFSRKNKKKNISKCSLLKILPRVLSVKFRYSIFCHFCSKAYFMDSHWNCLDEVISMSTPKISFCAKVTKLILNYHPNSQRFWTYMIFLG